LLCEPFEPLQLPSPRRRLLTRQQAAFDRSACADHHRQLSIAAGKIAQDLMTPNNFGKGLL
jgi:hypothetical protein